MRQLILLNVQRMELARLQKGLLKREVREHAHVSASSVNRAFARGEAGIRVAREICRVLGLELKDVWLMEGASQ